MDGSRDFERPGSSSTTPTTSPSPSSSATSPSTPPPAEELDELAGSIAESGLIDPITLDPHGTLLDGRNRLAACRAADVTPTFVIYDGDPVALIVARNSTRRHMSTGARAMATAVNLRDAGYRKDGRWSYGALANSGDSPNSTMVRAIRDAGLVLDHCDDLAAAVIAGDLALDAATGRGTGRTRQFDRRVRTDRPDHR